MFPLSADDARRLRDHETLSYGASQFRAGKCQAVCMRCFSRAEVDEYKAWATEHYPGVPIVWEWCAPLPGGREWPSEELHEHYRNVLDALSAGDPWEG